MDVTKEKLIEVARRFADALDACSYTQAADFLSPECRYHVSADDVLVDPEAILASYHECDVKARRDFDQIKYRSEATADESGGVRLTFFDELRRGGATHTYSSTQIVYFDEQTRIDRIELREISGERDRLNCFCKSLGIERD
jgi:hypothetical protein